jgi:DVNP family
MDYFKGDASGNMLMKGGKGTRTTRKANKMPAVGTKAMVFHGTAKHTSGGLTKKDLMKTKKGRIVSRKKHALGKKSLKNLIKAGFKAKKGTFKLFKRS